MFLIINAISVNMKQIKIRTKQGFYYYCFYHQREMALNLGLDEGGPTTLEDGNTGGTTIQTHVRMHGQGGQTHRGEGNRQTFSSKH